MKRKLMFCSMPVLLTGMVFSQGVRADIVEESQYCEDKGGLVEMMPAEYQTAHGVRTGMAQPFCTFQINGGFIAIGLSSFASKKPSIAASFIQTLAPIAKDSPLWRGKYANPGTNVCKNLGGANIGFNVPSGGFKNKLGQSDICVFGDGSMVSSWSLIYMANGREGYGKVKKAVRALPMTVSY